METNENVKNVNGIEKLEKANKTIKNNVIDMEATQKIVFLDEFIERETQKNNDKIIALEQEYNNNQNNNSNISEKSEAQQDVKSIKSEENVQTTPNEAINEQENMPKEAENIVNQIEKIEETEKTNTHNIEENDDIENIEVKRKKDIIATQPENTSNETEMQCSEEELEKKKKQHAQDKKDYRLERMLFDRINTMQGKIKESLELIKKFERINAKEENLPNIVTTLHDKLTHEVIKQFRTVGIEFNMKSFLVQSVVSDLLNKFEEGITEFKDCSENLNFVREVQDDFESRVELAPTSKVKNFFARIRGMFKPERKQEKLEELERDRQEKKLQEANIHLIKYKYINSELEKYTIKNNIVGSLSIEILYGQSSGLTNSVNDFFDKRIVSEMKQLGLENGIYELKDKIYNEYKQRDNSVSKEDFEQMPLGVLKRNMKLQSEDIMRSKISRVVNLNNSKEEENSREAI